MSVSEAGRRPPREESFADTVRRLGSKQKAAARGAPAYSRFVNRRIGRVLAAGAYHARMTPNQVTLVSAVFSAVAIAGIALVPPSALSGAGIALALLIGYAFDSADGQLARLTGTGSPAGEWLDHVVDSVKVSALHLAVLVSWFRFYEVPDLVLLIPLVFAVVYAVYFFAMILTEQLRRAHPVPSAPGGGGPGLLRALAVAPADYGLLCIVFVLQAWPAAFIGGYSFLFAGTTLLVLAALPKWYREMTRIRPAS